MTGISQAAAECANAYRLAFPEVSVPLCVMYARQQCPSGILIEEWIDAVRRCLFEIDKEEVSIC